MDDIILIDNNPVLVIKRDIYEEIINKSKENKVEIGGILIGYKLEGINEYRITEVTFPFENDECYPTLFIRKDKKHNSVLKRVHKKDNSLTYIGDWHSHPMSSSNPSDLDLSTYIDHTKNSITSAKHLFYIIVGIDLDIRVHSHITKRILKDIKVQILKD